MQTKAEIAAYNKAYHEAHKPEIAARNAAYREAHKAEQVAYDAARDARRGLWANMEPTQ